MNRIRCGLLAWLLLVSLAVQAQPSCRQPEVLHFAAIPKKDLQQQYREFEPMRARLQQVLGIPVRTVRVHSYQAVVEGLLSGAIDLAELGPAAYLRARARDPQIRALAAYRFRGGPFTVEGSYYNAVLLVRTQAPIADLRALAGRTVALTDPGSTSGALIPQTEFRREIGQALADYAGRLVYAGSHDRALEALLAGRVDAAFVSSRRADDYISQGRASAGELRELWRSRPIHYDPFTVSSRLCAPLQAAIRRVLLTDSPAQQALLQAKGAVGLVAVSDEDYRWLEPLLQQLD